MIFSHLTLKLNFLAMWRMNSTSLPAISPPSRWYTIGGNGRWATLSGWPEKSGGAEEEEKKGGREEEEEVRPET